MSVVLEKGKKVVRSSSGATCIAWKLTNEDEVFEKYVWNNTHGSGGR